ncbi:MAG: amino acid adenylation domain-containing protein, partial [Thermoanaerobaculia bacterium]
MNDRGAAVRGINRENVETLYRLSPVQQGMLFHVLYAPGEGVYFEQFVLRFEEPFDPEAFARAWQELVDHNAVLRTSFVWEGVEEPIQVVHRRVSLPAPVLDWRGLSVAEQEEKLRELRAGERQRGFDLTAAPLMRFSIVRLGDGAYQVVWSYSHLVLDGWSVGLLLQEVHLLYAAAVAGRPLQAQQRRPFRDYIAWLRQQSLAESEAYWRRVLDGFTTPTPLGIDRPAGRGGEDLGRDVRVALVPEAETEALKAWARQSRLTLSTVAQGAWALVLSRYSGEEDLVFGLTVSGRPPGLTGVEAMLGCFINTLPVRARVPAGERALPWLQGLQADQNELRLFEHSPLVQVQGWSGVPRPAPLFESIFVFEGFTQTAREGAFQRTGYPLTLVSGPDREMVLRADFELERFEPATVERLLGHLKSVLLAFAADPGQRLEEIGILTPEELQQLQGWSATGVRYGEADLLLHQIIERRAASQPDAVAVVFGEASLTYRELDARADRLAHRLRRLGVGPEVLAGVCAERSLEMVVALLAVLKAGGGYVPLDPGYPADRLAYMLADSRVPVLLTQTAVLGRLPATGARTVLLDAAMEEGLAADGPPEVDAGPDNLAYMIYTSGSTGRPKGAMNSHRGIVNRLLWMQEELGLDATDRVLQKTPFSFDVSVWEFFWPLMMGARLVMAKPGGHQDPSYLAEEIARRGVTTLHFVPSMLQVFLEAPGLERCASLRRVVCSGEALPAELQRRFHECFDAPLVNLYGPTEAAVDVSFWWCARGDGRTTVPIGHPVANTELHAVDRAGRLVPVGVAGELLLGGVQVGRGYHGRPELTAERFVPDPFSGRPGARLYRTGDLVRRLPGGAVEFLGRIDHQVKIRGFRIELGEIEAALAIHPAVREAVVVAADGQRLVAYLAGPGVLGIDPAELRSHLAATLPEHMIPAVFVPLEALPLSPNGKVDRRALPVAGAAASLGTGVAFTPPRTPVEEVVVAVWSEVLAVEKVGRDDNFFHLGGHSLLATRVASRLSAALEVSLPLRRLFEAPTVAGLASLIEAARSAGGTGPPPLRPGPREGDLPLSFSQERLWFLEQLQPGTAIYHIPNTVRMTGTLDVGALRRSLAEVVRRHEALRTVFAARGGRPVQVIREDLQPALPLVDLSALADPQAEIRRLSALISRRPFDLSAGPLLRPALLKLGEGEHVLLLTFHHIASDAWSLEVLLRELAALYPAFSSGRPSPLPELPVQYADFALWQRSWLHGEVLEEQLAYWRERLAGVPVLQLPGDRPRPAVQSFHGAMAGFALPETLSAAVHAQARAKGATVFMVLLAAYQALLARYSGQEDFAVGSPVAGRERREIEGLIGFFVNTLVLRAPLAGAPAFPELLDRVRSAALGAYAHQGVPFERIVQELAPERNLSYPPLFQVMLAFQSLGTEALELPGLTLAPQSDEFPVSKFDLTLTAFDTGSRIFGQWVYSTALFERETAARWSGHFQVLLEGLVTNPSQRVSELPLLTAGEREQILAEWNRPLADYPEEGFVHRLFEAQVEKTPDAAAAVFEGESLTYRELNARANRLARHLRRRGAGPEVLVGIRAERSFEMLVGLLAILKAGGAYLPLDPSLPEERLSYMMEDAGIELVVTGDLPDCTEESAESLNVPLLPDHAAYVIYTSGSTGRPKGVVVSHRALGNRLQYARAGDVLAADAFLQKTTISFDVSLLEIFAPLVIGGRTV